ncbi:MAG TPA: hypothetical protein VGL61_28905 [Kofleriaceae bacterium]|jgi:hypothetical protein
MKPRTSRVRPGELARDARRSENTPRYHGAEWQKVRAESAPDAEPVAVTTGERPMHHDVRRKTKRPR